MEFVLFELAFEFLSIREVLSALAMEETVQPEAFVFHFVSSSVKGSITSLIAFGEAPNVFGPVGPPESTLAMPSARLEFPFIDIALLSIPSVDSSTILLICFELPEVVISGRIVQFSQAFHFAIHKWSIDDPIAIQMITDALSVGLLVLWLSNVDRLTVLEKGRLMKGRFIIQDKGAGLFYHKDLF